ncbi:MAG TPA: cell division protein FtsZ [Rhizomicrobium sp.]|jgi:cell division protein FtsZ|nr:cell division protein FtsZ [Rhizomicrobium sp.]
MTIKIGAPETRELRPRITVLGIGGAGGNAVNNMISSKLEGVDFIVANTDAQALAQSKAEHKIQLGVKLTEGLGAGARPEVGRAGAEESLDEILEHLAGSHMVFITAGMGGGTGTGAAPVIARAVREQGVLTVGVVTKPFAFEGEKRLRIAERGIEELQAYVDTLIIIPNQNLFRIANDRTTFAQAFAMADDVLHSGVRGVTDLIVMPGLINLDFADIKTVMGEMGKAMMGTGEAEGEDRAMKAAEAAISNPLLDDVSMKGARGVLINITGGPDMMLFEVDQAANRIRAEVDPDANIIFGGTILENMEGRLRVSVVATGIESEAMAKLPPNVQNLRDRMKAQSAPTQMSRTPEPRPAATVQVQPHAPVANPVRAQVETLQQELNNPRPAPEPMQSAAVMMDEEDIIGHGVIGEDDIPPMPVSLQHKAMSAPLRPMPQPEPEAAPAKRRFGIFGPRKETPRPEPRMEPAAQRPAPRAAAQPMRNEQAKPSVDAGLFPEHQKDDQFEIPAFLRRQSN